MVTITSPAVFSLFSTQFQDPSSLAFTELSPCHQALLYFVPELFERFQNEVLHESLLSVRYRADRSLHRCLGNALRSNTLDLLDPCVHWCLSCWLLSAAVTLRSLGTVTGASLSSHHTFNI